MSPPRVESQGPPGVSEETEGTGWLGKAQCFKLASPSGRHSPPLPQASVVAGSGPRSFLFTRASRSLGNDDDGDDDSTNNT